MSKTWMIRSPGDKPSTGVMTNPRHLGWRRQVVDAHLGTVPWCFLEWIEMGL